MTHDELLARLYEYKSSNQGLFEMTDLYQWREALRAVVELADEPIDASGTSAVQVAWFYEGYNLAMDNIIQAIEKELK